MQLNLSLFRIEVKMNRAETLEFALAWCESDTLDDVSQRTGLSKSQASRLAAGLRRNGLAILRPFRRGPKPALTPDDYTEIKRELKELWR